MDLETALTTISVLEKQLEELESTSNEYEEELEATIERLKEELHKRDQGKESSTEDHKVVPRHVQITVLEIRIDELENENRSLKSQLQTLQEENDSILERNVLLQHELADVTNLIRVPRQHHPKELIQGGKIRVSSDRSSLHITTRASTDSNNITHLSSTTVMAKTNYK